MANVETKNSTGNGNSALVEAKDAQNLLPHLECLERIIQLPVVGAAWDKSQDVYGKVKGRLEKYLLHSFFFEIKIKLVPRKLPCYNLK